MKRTILIGFMLSTLNMSFLKADIVADVTSFLESEASVCDEVLVETQASYSDALMTLESTQDALVTCESILDIIEPELTSAQEILAGIESLDPIIKISANGVHTVVLLENGSVWAAGNNQFGQLGTGDTFNRAGFTPMVTDASYVFTDIAAGLKHTIVLKNDGTVWATGDNTYGQLGLNSLETQTLILTQMATDISFVGTAVAAGEQHSLVLKSDGTVWATGDNSKGQLGLDSLETQTLVLTKMTLNNSDVTAIAAGDQHSLILKSDGTVWATGNNGKGQLGLDSSETQTLVLTKMTLNNSDITAIAAGDQHSIALKSDGNVWATGDNAFGQLGLNSSETQTLVLTEMTLNNGNVNAIAAGGSQLINAAHSLVLKNDGTVYATGDNTYGQLGIGSTSNQQALTQMTLNNANITAITAGMSHSVVLKSDGTVWTTGNNTSGQLSREFESNNPAITTLGSTSRLIYQ